MRLLIICALCILAAPATAQNFDMQIVNGIRVWSPKLQQREPMMDEPQDPQTTGSATVRPGDMYTINGVRIWSPKPPPPEPVVIAPPLPVSITINQVYSTPAYDDAFWPLDYGPFLGPIYEPRPFLHGRRAFRGLHGSSHRPARPGSPILPLRR